MTTKLLTLAAAGIILLVSAVRFMASPGVRSKSPRRLHPRLDAPGEDGQGLTKTEAEDLLDWLEAHGIRDRHVSYQPGKGFFVN
jgi:hypothetical protein